MRLLFLTSRLPFPPNRGDRSRTFHFLRVLGQEHEITLVSFVSTRDEAEMAKELDPFCADIHLVHRPALRSLVSAITNFWRRYPLQYLFYRSQTMQRLVDRLLASETYEAAYVHLFRMAPYVVDHPGIYRIVDLTDVISQEIAGSLPYRSMPSRFLYRFEQPRIASYERQVAGWAEEAWLISERDKSILTETCPQANLKVVPIGVDLDHYHLAPQMEMAHNLLFVGHLGVFHNIDAVTFLVEQILPIVRQDVPDCILTIIGAGLSSKISELERYPGVKVLGFVPDLNRALNGTAVFVAPLRFSAGVQTKVLEAMAAGVPVVTTSSVNAGLAAQPDQEVLVGDGAPELASQVIKLLRDDLFRSQLGRAGRRFVEQRFSWQVAAGRLNQVEQLLSQKGDTVI